MIIRWLWETEISGIDGMGSVVSWWALFRLLLVVDDLVDGHGAAHRAGHDQKRVARGRVACWDEPEREKKKRTCYFLIFVYVYTIMLRGGSGIFIGGGGGGILYIQTVDPPPPPPKRVNTRT